MPRTKEQFEAMRKASRDKIVTAAVHVFSLKGYAAANVQDIADSAGISVGLLYRHFKTKEDIFGSILGEALVGYEEIRQLLESDALPAEIMRTFLEEVVYDLANNKEFTQMVLLLTQPFLSNLNFPWMAGLLEGSSQMVMGIAKLIKKGQQLGEFKPGDPIQMAQYLFSCIQGMCMSKHVLKDEYRPPTAEMALAFLLR